MFPNNAKRSPPDDRDWIAESIFTRSRDFLPSTLDLRKDLLAVRSQGNRGTCAAFAASAMKEYQEKRDINYTSYLSPEFIYFHRENKPESGMYGRNVMKILVQHGVSTEDEFPYQDADVETVPKHVIDDATNLKIKSYAQVNTIEGTKKALYLNGVCYIGFPTYDNGVTFWKPKNKGDPTTGGHAVAIVGYNKTGFIIRNSWGAGWNGDGHFIYPYTDFGSHWEIWATIDDKSIAIPPPANPLIALVKSLLACFTPK